MSISKSIRWGDIWVNHAVLVIPNYQALVYIINKQTVRILFYSRRYYNSLFFLVWNSISFKVKDIPGALKLLGFALSRLQVPEFSSCCPRFITNKSSVAISQLFSVIGERLSPALASSTQTAYRRAWRAIHIFLSQYICILLLLLQPAHITISVAHLFWTKFFPETITSYLSAIAFSHKLHFARDPTESFLI